MTVVAIPNGDYPPAEDALAGAAHIATDLDDVRLKLIGSLPQAR
jgi:hypothetical protein